MEVISDWETDDLQAVPKMYCFYFQPWTREGEQFDMYRVYSYKAGSRYKAGLPHNSWDCHVNNVFLKTEKVSFMCSSFPVSTVQSTVIPTTVFTHFDKLFNIMLKGKKKKSFLIGTYWLSKPCWMRAL